MWKRALIAWLLIIVAESLHGTLRQLLLAPLIGDFRARQVSVFTGSVFILLIAYALIGWIGARRTSHLLAIGVGWLLLTVLFEFTLGRLLGMDWQRLLADYDLRRGGLMSFGMLVLLLSPLATARLRNRLRERKAR